LFSTGDCGKLVENFVPCGKFRQNYSFSIFPQVKNISDLWKCGKLFLSACKTYNNQTVSLNLLWKTFTENTVG
jgi:hypothetical protein